MLDLRKIAQQETTLSELMIDKEKGETKDLIARKESVTIVDCDFVTQTKDGKSEEYWIFVTEEYPTKFFYAGCVMDRIFNATLKQAQGDYDEVRKAVREQTLTVKFDEKKTSDGKRTVTTVTVI